MDPLEIVKQIEQEVLNTEGDLMAVTQPMSKKNLIFGFIVPALLLIAIVGFSVYSKNYIASSSVAQITKAQITNSSNQTIPAAKEKAVSDTVTPETKEAPEPIEISVPEPPIANKIAR